jgi:hypothetical protein
MSTPARLIATVVKRLERLERIRRLMSSRWEPTGSRKCAVRRDDVVKWVGDEIGEEVNNRLRTAVLLLAKQLGWKPANRENRRLFICVKRRGMTDTAALAGSSALVVTR